MSDNIILGINLSPFLDAVEKFEKFRAHMLDEQDRAGAIQAFEVCFAMSWKLMQRLLAQHGIDVHSPRDVIHEAGVKGFLDNPSVWFQFIDKRNLAVDAYKESTETEIIAIFPLFSEAVHAFIQRLKTL